MKWYCEIDGSIRTELIKGKHEIDICGIASVMEPEKFGVEMWLSDTGIDFYVSSIDSKGEWEAIGFADDILGKDFEPLSIDWRDGNWESLLRDYMESLLKQIERKLN